MTQAFTLESQWPDTGNWLLYHHLEFALLNKNSPEHLRKSMKQVVKRAVLSGAKDNYNEISRKIFRFSIKVALSKEIKKRRSTLNATVEPSDLLDIIIKATPENLKTSAIIEIFFSFIFSIAGSVGFLLGWSIYMLASNNHAKTFEKAKPSWIVLETLRLWPVAWNLSRKPAVNHTIAGVNVTPQDTVIVCPYAVHRNPNNWKQATTFNPFRWQRESKNHLQHKKETKSENNTFIPFGWGEHICPAAHLSMQLVEHILTLLTPYQLTVLRQEAHPPASAALAPPQFMLQSIIK